MRLRVLTTINFNLPRNSIITLNTQVGFNGNISIVGPGASLLTIQRSAAAGTPIFQIFSFAPINGNFNDFISGVTISNGDATGTFSSNMSGGGILSSSFCALTLTDVVITGNTSTNGGGLYNDGTATLTDCKITGNSSPNGGGILNGGSPHDHQQYGKRERSSEWRRRWNSEQGWHGKHHRQHSEWQHLRCSGRGIVNKDGLNGAGSVTLTNSTVSGNSATGVLSNGIGGISNNAGANTLTLTSILPSLRIPRVEVEAALPVFSTAAEHRQSQKFHRRGKYERLNAPRLERHVQFSGLQPHWKIGRHGWLHERR